jgi:hypothetical protein
MFDALAAQFPGIPENVKQLKRWVEDPAGLAVPYLKWNKMHVVLKYVFTQVVTHEWLRPT